MLSTTIFAIMEIKDRIQEIAQPNPGAFAKKAGISDQLMRKYLKGSEPGADKIKKIAEAAGVNEKWLLSGKGEKYNRMEAGKHIRGETDSQTPVEVELQNQIILLERIIASKDSEIEALKRQIAMLEGGKTNIPKVGHG